MSTQQDGGPAFPKGRIEGMSLRDYLAAHAPEMPDQWWKALHAQWPMKHVAEIDADWRYFHADAMLAARTV